MNTLEKSFNALERDSQKRYEKIGKKRGESASETYAKRIADEMFVNLLTHGEASLTEALARRGSNRIDKKDQKETLRWDGIAHEALERGDYDLLDTMTDKIRTFEGGRHARSLALEHISKWVREQNIQKLSEMLSADSRFVEDKVFPSGMRRLFDVQQLEAMEQKGMTYLDILEKEMKRLKNPILQRHFSPDTRDEETHKEKETVLLACKTAILALFQKPKTSSGYIALFPHVGTQLEEIVRRAAYLGVATLPEIKNVCKEPDIQRSLIGLLAKSISEAPLGDYTKAFIQGFSEYVLYAQKARFSAIVSQLLDSGLYSQEDIAALQDQVLEKVRKNSQRTHVVETLQKALKEESVL
ncbi:MAG: hypothetical protein AAB400_04525 [Patescibacteria group bacterium]